MDLFFNLPKNVQRKTFSFTPLSMEKLRQLLTETTLEKDDSNERFAKLSVFGIEQLPFQRVPLQKIHNPYKKWRRIPKKKIFVRGHWKRSIPDADFDPSLNPNVAYIVEGYSGEGAYAFVDTFVVYNNTKAVIKKIDLDDLDWFELVAQAYLHEACKIFKHVHVPKLLFLQRAMAREGLYTQVCMEMASGVQLMRLSDISILVALAHAMKALYRLQHTVHFMHRDLSGHNIYFNPFSHDVTFIDFGMACVNPNLRPVAWQSKDNGFYKILPGTNAAKCTNRSLDASMLMSHLSYKHPWLHWEHVRMKRAYKRVIEESENDQAKQDLRPPKTELQYTTIRPGGWVVGNELVPWDFEKEEGDGWHWWLFNMIEFPVVEYYPENVLSRLLPQLPIDHWFALRRDWSDVFDDIMPKNIQVRLTDGRVGTLKGLVRRKLIVDIEHETMTIKAQDGYIQRSTIYGRS